MGKEKEGGEDDEEALCFDRSPTLHSRRLLFPKVWEVGRLPMLVWPDRRMAVLGEDLKRGPSEASKGGNMKLVVELNRASTFVYCSRAIEEET